MQRVKRADEQGVPRFDDVLDRPLPTSQRRPARRVTWAIAFCCVAALLVAIFVVRWQRDSVVERKQRIAEEVALPKPDKEPQNVRIEEIDFDEMHQAVVEHFHAVATSTDAGIPVWSSRTECLLTLHLNDSQLQE